MSTNTAIQWTEATWNPIAGCTPNSPGCLNCYAATMANRLAGMGQAKYRGLTVLHNGRHTFNGTISYDEAALSIPLKRKKPTMYFVNSMSDLFHEAVSFDFVDRVFAVMALCPQHTFQILTKRPERMAEYLNETRCGEHWKGYSSTHYHVHAAAQHMCNQLVDGTVPAKLGAKIPDADWRVPRKLWAEFFAFPEGMPWPLPNVWLGCSPVNQKTYDAYRPHMERLPAAVRFLSLEPLLGPIDLGINPPAEWVIVGGESGARSRVCYTNWIDSIIAQCKSAGVPVFVKQVGANHRCVDDEVGDVHIKLKDHKGGDPDEWPENLRVREFPDATSSLGDRG